MANTYIAAPSALADSPRRGDDFRTGGDGSARIGGDGSDALVGTAQMDFMWGGNGNDVLNGGSGVNFMAGGDGADKFVLDTGCGWDAAGKPLNVSGNLSYILDLSQSQGDKVVLDITNLPFLDMTGKPLDFAMIPSNWFSTTDSRSYIFYDQASGKVFYDKDAGNWDHEDTVCCTPCEIAVLTNHVSLTSNDFVLVNQSGVIWGMTGNDELIGGAENNTIRGGAGINTLTGGAGADKFVLDTACNWDAAGNPISAATNLSIITDFNSAQGDKIVINRAALPFLNGTGAPQSISAAPSNWFSTTNPESYFYYDQSTGSLFYDKDAGAWDHKDPVCCLDCKVAVLDNHAALTAADFIFA